MREVEEYYYDKPEPMQGCLLALKDILLGFNDEIIPLWRYRTPCFSYNSKMFCYIWIDAKTKLPYIGFTNGWKIKHALLTQKEGKRTRVVLIDPKKDIPKEEIDEILEEILKLYE